MEVVTQKDPKSKIKSENTKFYVTLGITLAIMFGFGYLPPFGEVSPQGMKILGIFLGCIFAWCVGEIAWSSVLGLVSLVLFGFGTMNGNFASAYANPTIATMITAIVFCFAVEQSGLLREISKWIVSQKWAQTSPWSLVFAFYLAALIVGALATNVLPAVILLWALFYEMAGEIGLKPYEKLSTIILLGIGVVGYVGVAIMPYAAMTIVVRGAAVSYDPTFVFNTGQYLLLNLMTALIFVPLVVLILRLFVGKTDFVVPKRDAYKMKLNREMKWCLSGLIIVVASMLLPNLLPDGNVIKVILGNKLGIVGVFMLLSAILMMVRVDGKPILDISVGIRNVPWTLILLVSSALAISAFITADGMGIVPTIVSWLNPLMEGKSALVITLLFVAIGLIMTNFINDIVTCVVLYPIGAQFIMDAGGSVMLFAILFAQVTIQGCFVPSGSVMGAMFHGNSEWMKSKDVFKYVAIMEFVLLAVLLVVSLVGRMLGI